jgi:hypothetical protein
VILDGILLRIDGFGMTSGRDRPDYSGKHKAVSAGIRQARPDAAVVELPLADGGVGSVVTALEAAHYRQHAALAEVGHSTA